MISNKLKRLGLALSVAGAFSGCGTKNYSSYEGHPVTLNEGQISTNGKVLYTNGRILMIKDIHGNSLIAGDYDKDGRYDNIGLQELPKGSPLEQFANPQSLKEITDKILNEAKADKPQAEKESQ
jgi:hypothetical protein